MIKTELCSNKIKCKQRTINLIVLLWNKFWQAVLNTDRIPVYFTVVNEWSIPLEGKKRWLLYFILLNKCHILVFVLAKKLTKYNLAYTVLFCHNVLWLLLLNYHVIDFHHQKHYRFTPRILQRRRWQMTGNWFTYI